MCVSDSASTVDFCLSSFSFGAASVMSSFATSAMQRASGIEETACSCFAEETDLAFAFFVRDLFKLTNEKEPRAQME